MKRLVYTALLVAGIAAGANAQSVGKDVKKAANKVGNKTSEVAVKGYSGVVDKKYAGKAGPNNETIYIDKNSNYYYINKKGKRIYIKESELKAKVD
jgi:predicted small secreted protein